MLLKYCINTHVKSMSSSLVLFYFQTCLHRGIRIESFALSLQVQENTRGSICQDERVFWRPYEHYISPCTFMDSHHGIQGFKPYQSVLCEYSTTIYLSGIDTKLVQNWTLYNLLYLPCYHSYRVDRKCVNIACAGAKSRFWALLSDLHGIIGRFR